MKNLLFILAFLCIASRAKAQQLDFTNLVTCDVVIGYEMRDTNCGVCATGTATINPGLANVLYMTPCTGYIDMCIWIIDIDGCAPTAQAAQINHLSSGNGCHTPANTSYSGNVGCCGNISFTATWNGTSFLIQ